jgi:hypothetical protein
MALARTIKNKAEATCRRGDLPETYREFMDTWTRYAISGAASIFEFHAT